MASIAETAQALALACLSHADFVANLVPPRETTEASAKGKKVAEFYAAIQEELIKSAAALPKPTTISSIS